MGARNDRDGMDAVRCWASGGANQSVEAMEHAWPFIVEAYALADDTGGAGTFRGGLGSLRDLRVLTEAKLSMTSGRQLVPAWGLSGGLTGVPGRFWLNPGTDREQQLPAAFADLSLQPGDVVRLVTPGGGGYGDPRQRDPERVRIDVIEGRVSAAAARDLYGVVVQDGEIDWPATHDLRGEPTSTPAASATRGGR
jgi:N-methylhydantoinase B